MLFRKKRKDNFSELISSMSEVINKNIQSDLNRAWRKVSVSPLEGGWQRGLARDGEKDGFFAFYSCKSLIAGDISKLRVNVKVKENGIKRVVENNISRLLEKPNRYQNTNQFFSWWLNSKLDDGNTIVLKKRNVFDEVTELHIMPFNCTSILVSDEGRIYYKFAQNKLAGVQNGELFSSRDVIHDRYFPLENPLIGISPVLRAYLSGQLGLKIQEDSLNFISNGSNLSGVVSFKGRVDQEEAELVEKRWKEVYGGKNAGAVAVLGDDAKFETLRAKSVDSQIIEHLKLSAEIVASCFHVPPFKIGMATPPARPDDANLIYYSDCLQVLIEELEQCLKAGLELKSSYEIEFETEDLLRMNEVLKTEILGSSVKNSLRTVNEARKAINEPAKAGGDSIYMQQQNYSLEALAKRDAKENPFERNISNRNLEQTPLKIPEELKEDKKEYNYIEFEKKFKEACKCPTL